MRLSLKVNEGDPKQADSSPSGAARIVHSMVTLPGSTATVIIHRWRLKPGSENDLAAAWEVVTRHLRSARGSLGSRLHRGQDGLWHAYAAWPSLEHRAAAFEADGPDEVVAAGTTMQARVAESFPDIRLTPTCDLRSNLSTIASEEPAS